MMKHCLSYLLSALCVLSACSGQTVKLLTYNVGAFSKELDDSTPLVASLIESIGAETVGLNEVDSCNRRHDTDQLSALSSQLGPRWDRQYARAMEFLGGAYGNGIVTKCKIQRKGTVELPKCDGSEPRSVAYIETPCYVFAALHLDFASENAALQQLEVATGQLKLLFGRSSKPVFLAGDFNSSPSSPLIEKAKDDWFILTPPQPSYPSDNPKACIDYIMQLKAGKRVNVLGAGICSLRQFTDALGPDIEPSILSDHLPVWVEIKL